MARLFPDGYPAGRKAANSEKVNEWSSKLIFRAVRLPSVRQLAEDIGINMHTVNKAYAVLRQEGFLTIDRRRGAVIALDADKMQALDEMKRSLRVLLAKGRCKSISCREVHELVDEIFAEYAQEQ